MVNCLWGHYLGKKYLMNSLQNETFSLQNKTIILTGSTSGLGEHFAKTLAKAGAFVVLCGRNAEKIALLKKEIQQFGGKCGDYLFDLTNFDELDGHIQKIFEQFGPVHVLVNNAGLTSKIKKEPFEYTLEEWDSIFNANVKSMWAMSNSVAKRMIEHKLEGSIVNISSTNGLRPRPTNTLYCLSKASVNALTQNLAMELGKYNIRVNAIAPGPFGAGMSQNIQKSDAGIELVQKRFPMARIGLLKELDGPLLLLCSQASNYMTGNCLYVDGGLVTGSVQ